MKKMLPQIFAFLANVPKKAMVLPPQKIPVDGFKKKLFFIVLVFTAGYQSTSAQTVLTIADTASWNSTAPRTQYTYESGDTIKYLAATITDGEFSFVPATTTTSGSQICGTATKRIQTNTFELTLKSTSAATIVISGTSSGTAIRALRAILVNGVLLDPDDYVTANTFPAEGNTSSTCGDISITGLSIPTESRVIIVFGSSASSSPQNVRVSQITITPDPTLPVGLVSFNAFNRGSGVELVWSVSNESEGRAYTIERSTDGRIFTPIKTIQAAGAGRYTYTDNSPKTGRMVYYRLQLLSIDGSKAFSQINALSLGGSGDLQVTPNPVRGGNLFLTFNPSREVSTMRILNMDGKVVLSSMIAPNMEQANINTSKLIAGSYLVQIINGSDIQTKRFVRL